VKNVSDNFIKNINLLNIRSNLNFIKHKELIVLQIITVTNVIIILKILEIFFFLPLIITITNLLFCTYLLLKIVLQKKILGMIKITINFFFSLILTNNYLSLKFLKTCNLLLFLSKKIFLK
jgi:hypothetical protein